MANVVGQTGWSAVTNLLTLMLGFYLTCVVFVFGVPRCPAAGGVRGVDLQAGALSGPGVPADLRNVVLGEPRCPG